MQVTSPVSSSAIRFPDALPRSSAGGRDAPGGFRPDVEGLRAIAVILVLAYHAGLPFVSGGFVGVDVFFVISGYLITALLLREVEKTGRIRMMSFWARRARRLLPAATLVLLATTAATWALGPVTQRTLFAGDVIAAAASLVNWRLADRSVEYLAEDVGASPVQQFWSLAVEEQYYVLWPALIALIGLIALRRRIPARRAAAVALALIALPSFAASLWLTSTDPAPAYFVTTTRLWELAIGALVAVAALRLARLHARARGVLAFGGVVLLFAAAVLIDANDPFPGWRAAIPAVGCALVIASGIGGASGSVGRLLSWRPLVWIGGISYSLYLWHWPMLVVLQDWMGFEGRRWGVIIVLASVVPAYLSFRLVENPIRRSRALGANVGLSLSLGLNLVLATVIAALLVATLPATATVADSPSVTAAVGAQALGTNPTSSEEAIPRASYEAVQPSPLVASEDIPECWSANSSSDELNPCAIGDADGEVSVVILGDSKIQQYADALDAVFAELGWSGTVLTKSGCAFSDARSVADGGARAYTGCDVFNERALTWLEENPQDLAITSQRAGQGYLGDDFTDRSTEAMVSGLVSRWNTLHEGGTEVIVVLDNPAPPAGVPMLECTASHPEAMDTCAFARDEGIDLSAAPTQLAAAAQVPQVQVVDLADYICPGEMCTPVIGGVLVYRQGSHITSTYAKSMHEILVQRLDSAYHATQEG